MTNHRLPDTDLHPEPAARDPYTMHGEALGEALDGCLDEMLLRGRSAAECLRHWPELRDELEPLLDVATRFSAFADPGSPAPSSACYRRLFDALHETPPGLHRHTSAGHTLARLHRGLQA